MTQPRWPGVRNAEVGKTYQRDDGPAPLFKLTQVEQNGEGFVTVGRWTQ